jgi:hypothetical protein
MAIVRVKQKDSLKYFIVLQPFLLIFTVVWEIGELPTEFWW